MTKCKCKCKTLRKNKTKQNNKLPARRLGLIQQRWEKRSSLARSCCCHCWPARRDEDGAIQEYENSPSSGGHTLETPKRELTSNQERNSHIERVQMPRETEVCFNCSIMSCKMHFTGYSVYNCTLHGWSVFDDVAKHYKWSELQQIPCWVCREQWTLLRDCVNRNAAKERRKYQAPNVTQFEEQINYLTQNKNTGTTKINLCSLPTSDSRWFLMISPSSKWPDITAT